MQPSIRSGILLVGLIGGVFAQSMIEHATVVGPASAGATAGAAAGFKLSEALKSTLDGAASTGAAKPLAEVNPPIPAAKPEHNVAPPPSFFSGDSSAPLPAASSGLSPVRKDMPAPPQAPAVAAEVFNGVPTAEPLTVVKPLAPVVLTAELSKDRLLAEAANLQTGSARDLALTKLGAPAYKISFDEDGSFMERCRFRSAGEDLVVVEFKDGLISSVKLLAP
jgi:hypothetical protein